MSLLFDHCVYSRELNCDGWKKYEWKLASETNWRQASRQQFKMSTLWMEHNSIQPHKPYERSQCDRAFQHAKSRML